MNKQYGTKSWAKWAFQNLDFALMLLKEPSKQWDKELTRLEAAARSLGIIRSELQESLVGGEK